MILYKTLAAETLMLGWISGQNTVTENMYLGGLDVSTADQLGQKLLPGKPLTSGYEPPNPARLTCVCVCTFAYVCYCVCVCCSVCVLLCMCTILCVFVCFTVYVFVYLLVCVCVHHLV